MIETDLWDPPPATTGEGNNCYDAEALTAYINGWESDEQCVLIESHLAECHRCDTLLGQLEEASDTFVRSLRDTAADPVINPVVAAQTRIDAPAAPTETGPYELLRPLGRGAMGTVYLARHRQLNKLVAIKLLPPHLVPTPESKLRFEREILCCGQMDHAAIVKATDASLREESAFLVMEYIDGLDLSRIVRATGPMSVANACEIIRQTAIGLQHAHDAGIVHRDVKPSNLMLDRTGRIRILDFGVARIRGTDAGTLTHADQLMGTLDYMAPEQATAPQDVSPRADLFALGATLFRLLTGRPPLMSESCHTVVEKLQQVTTASAPPLSEFCAEAPPELCVIVDALLERNPENRPTAASVVAAELESFCAGADLSALLLRSEMLASSKARIPDTDSVSDASVNQKSPGLVPQRTLHGTAQLIIALTCTAAIVALCLWWPLLSDSEPVTLSGPPATTAVQAAGSDDERKILPRVLIGISSFDQFGANLRSLQRLDKRTDSRLDHDLDDYLQLFGIGLNHSRPILIDVLTDFRDLQYVMHLPVPAPGEPTSGNKNRRDVNFRDSLDSFGYQTRPTESDTALYSVTNNELTDFGWLRFHSDEHRCALFVTRKKDLITLIRPHIDDALVLSNDAARAVTSNLGATTPLRLSLTNSSHSTSAQFRRRVNFREHYRLSTAAPRPPQKISDAADAASAADSGLERAFRNLHMGEFERLYAETIGVQAELTIEPDLTGATIQILATPIADSSLEQSLRTRDSTPDRFAELLTPDGPRPILQFHSMLPLDSVRQENLNALLTAVHEKLSGTNSLQNDFNITRKEAADVLRASLVEISRDVIRTGNLNAHVEAFAEVNGSISAVAALAIPDATRLNSMIPLLKNLTAANTIESVPGFTDEFDCYRIRLMFDDQSVTRILPEIRRDILLCVSENEVWLGFGPAADELLHRKLGSAGKTAAVESAASSPNTSNLQLTIRPFVFLQRDRAVGLLSAEPDRLADLFRPDDVLSFHLAAENGRQQWRASVSHGVMHYYAGELATFVRNNLR